MILHAVPSLRLNTGGPAQSVPQLANALSTHQMITAVIVDDFVRNHSEYAALNFDLVSCSKENSLRQYQGALLLHIHGVWLPFHHRLCVWARGKGIPIVISPRGMLEPWSLKHRKWKKRIAWFFYQRRDLFSALGLHATSDEEASHLKYLGFSGLISVIPNGVAIPGQYSCDEHGPRHRTALFMGRIHPKKGLKLLAEAWAIVRPVGWKMKVIGPDECGHKREILQLVRELHLNDVWSFHDPIYGDQKWREYNESSLTILPTYSENFGISVAESLASSRPVITTTGTPWKRLVEKNAGWCVAPTSEALSKALKTATQTPFELLLEMGENGRQWVEAEFSWKAIAKEMRLFYDEVLDLHRISRTDTTNNASR